MNSIIESEPQPYICVIKARTEYKNLEAYSFQRPTGNIVIENWQGNAALDAVLESCYSMKRNREARDSRIIEMWSPDPEVVDLVKDVMRRYWQDSNGCSQNPNQKVQASAP